VAILDADKEGFLRSTRSLIQTIGRAARNIHGKAILYAESVTASMRTAIDETERRREKQAEWNRRHGITPKSVEKAVRDIIDGVGDRTRRYPPAILEEQVALSVTEHTGRYGRLSQKDLGRRLKELEKRMYDHARNLEFEQAARLRDEIQALRQDQFRAADLPN